MESLSSIEQLNRLTRPFLRRGVMTNCFLPPAEFQWHIGRGRASYYQGADSLVILFHRQNVDHLYYYLRDGGRVPCFTQDRPAVLEIVRGDEHQAQASRLWQEQGFAIAVRRLRMESADLNPSAWGESGVQSAHQGQTAEIMDLLVSGFHPLTGFIPDLDELGCCISRGEIICGEADGQVTGLLQYKNERSISEIRHLLVKPESRGGGMAHRLLNHYKGRQDNAGFKRLRVWVNEDNERARTFYEKNGYHPDGLQSDVLVAGN